MTGPNDLRSNTPQPASSAGLVVKGHIPFEFTDEIEQGFLTSWHDEVMQRLAHDHLFRVLVADTITQVQCVSVAHWGQARMLPKDAFLRKIPIAVHPVEAIRLEGLVFSTDTIQSSYERIFSITTKYGKGVDAMLADHRVELFTHAWTIVDHLHVCRQLLKSLGLTKQDAKLELFCEKYESASLLRNKMDHLNDNAGNLAKTKLPRPPLFGSISYVHIPHEQILQTDHGPKLQGGGIVNISAGSLRFNLGMQLLNPAGRMLKAPVSCFQLEAFDQCLRIEDAVDDLRQVIRLIDVRLSDDFMKQAQKAAAEKSVPLDKLLAHPGGGLAFYIAVKFD